ncbi:MAG: large subunit ribosomal protein [Frankiales bacterium]|jgi:large subunit ribosomal protein L30|nr:large subunit ribosomal protein [Frankiales bacterium]
MSKIKVTQIRSGIGGQQRQKDTLRSLGLRKPGQSVIKDDKPEIRGMVRAVSHLVTVEEVD